MSDGIDEVVLPAGDIRPLEMPGLPLRDGRHGPSTGVVTMNQDDRTTRRLCLRSRYGPVFDLVER